MTSNTLRHVMTYKSVSKTF